MPDVAGDAATATHGYVVLKASRRITNQALFKSEHAIPIILELGSRRRSCGGGIAVVRPVGCATHEAAGPDVAANVKTHLNKRGMWCSGGRTGARWRGTCRSLIVRLGLDGWSSADAVFTLRFK